MQEIHKRKLSTATVKKETGIYIRGWRYHGWNPYFLNVVAALDYLGLELRVVRKRKK